MLRVGIPERSHMGSRSAGSQYTLHGNDLEVDIIKSQWRTCRPSRLLRCTLNIKNIQNTGSHGNNCSSHKNGMSPAVRHCDEDNGLLCPLKYDLRK